MADVEMNKVTQYRLGCVQICDKYVNLLKATDADFKCPKKLHPYDGMEVHEDRQEKELYCENVVECAKCRERHYEGLKDFLLSKYSIRRTWRDKEQASSLKGGDLYE